MRVASSLRDGMHCVFIQGKQSGKGSIMGLAYHHSWIMFDDAVKWTVRIPFDVFCEDIPAQLIEYLVESEYATLKFLEHFSVPTPRAHAYGLASDSSNLVGVSYILEDAMPGRPYSPGEATAEQKLHVLGQYASYMQDFRGFPRSKACSLVPAADGVKEGPIAGNSSGILNQHGPFYSHLEYFASIADHHMTLVADGQLYPEHAKEAFLFYKLLKEKVAPILAQDDKTRDEFFLRHAGDIGDHILVDEFYNITAIIDWEFARFVPACEAFGSSAFTADVSKVSGATIEPNRDDELLARCLEEKGSGELARYASGNELVRRFHVGLASGFTKDEILEMIKAVLILLDDDGHRDVYGWMGREWANSTCAPKRAKLETLLDDIERDEMEFEEHKDE